MNNKTHYLMKGDVIFSFTTPKRGTMVTIERRTTETPSPRDPDCYIVRKPVEKARQRYQELRNEGYRAATCESTPLGPVFVYVTE